VKRVMHEDQVTVSADALAAALAQQFPHLSATVVVAVESAGTVIAPFRVGRSLLARVPLVPVGGSEAVTRVDAEGRYARLLSDRLPVRVPRLVGVGAPFEEYGGVWSLWTWLEGQSLDRVLHAGAGCDLDALAVDLARVLVAHRSLPTGGGGWSGMGRGGRPLADTEWVRASIRRSAHLIDPATTTELWEDALAAPAHEGAAVSINGDAVPGNFLLSDGRLSGMIDVAEPVVGDPAADLQPSWVVFEEPQRSTFRDAMGLDEAAWRRGRGWAFEMAIGGLHYYEHTNPIFFAMARRTLHRLLSTS
jgi:aminoglycoside phosphotransferase (APT) family kinase protein